MASVGCDSLVGTMELGTLGLGSSVAVVEEGGGWAGSGARGTGLGGLGPVTGVVAEVGMTTPGGGGCEEGPGTVPVDVGGFF